MTSLLALAQIHFIYHQSSDPNAIPLLLLHGWPGSAFEFLEVVKILRESTTQSFVRLLPSLLISSFY